MTTLAAAVVILLATIVRSSFGFGEALVAVPLLALIMPVTVAVPLAVLVSIVVASIVIAVDWRHIELRSAGRLILATLFGIPLGLLLLKSLPARVVKGLLGAVILGFSAYSLIRHGKLRLQDDRLAWLFGFVAGIFGGAYGINGPPLAIYGSLRGWPPAKFRATLQSYFLPASFVGMCGYRLVGLWTPTVNRLFLWSLPSIAAGVVIGHFVNRRLEARRFLKLLHVGLCVIGLLLLSQAAGLGRLL